MLAQLKPRDSAHFLSPVLAPGAQRGPGLGPPPHRKLPDLDLDPWGLQGDGVRLELEQGAVGAPRGLVQPWAWEAVVEMGLEG